MFHHPCSPFRHARAGGQPRFLFSIPVLLPYVHKPPERHRCERPLPACSPAACAGRFVLPHVSWRLALGNGAGRLRLLRWFLGICAVLLLIVAIGTYVLARRHAAWQEARLAELEAEVRALGFPLTREELAAWNSLPDGAENAAYHFRQLKPLLDKLEPSMMDDERQKLREELDERAPGEAATDDMRERMRAVLDAQRPFLDAIVEAAPYAESVIYEPEGAVLMGSLLAVDINSTLRKAVRSTTSASRFAAHLGDHDAAVQYHLAGLAAAESLAREPNMLSHLVRLGFHRILAEQLRHSLAKTPFSEPHLRQLALSYEGISLVDSYFLSLAGESVVGAEMIHAEYGDAPLPPSQGSSVLRLLPKPLRDGLARNERIALIEHMLQFYVLDGKPMHAIIPAVENIESNFGMLQIFARLAAPYSRGVYSVFAQYEASLRMVRTALAIERYERAHGALPEALDALTPGYLDAIPIDPFDGQPIRYQVRDNGYLLYSIGPDGGDDGGEPFDYKEREGAYTFAVERAPSP